MTDLGRQNGSQSPYVRCMCGQESHEMHKKADPPSMRASTWFWLGFGLASVLPTVWALLSR